MADSKEHQDAASGKSLSEKSNRKCWEKKRYLVLISSLILAVPTLTASLVTCIGKSGELSITREKHLFEIRKHYLEIATTKFENLLQREMVLGFLVHVEEDGNLRSWAQQELNTVLKQQDDAGKNLRGRRNELMELVKEQKKTIRTRTDTIMSMLYGSKDEQWSMQPILAEHNHREKVLTLLLGARKREILALCTETSSCTKEELSPFYLMDDYIELKTDFRHKCVPDTIKPISTNDAYGHERCRDIRGPTPIPKFDDSKNKRRVVWTLGDLDCECIYYR